MLGGIRNYFGNRGKCPKKQEIGGNGGSGEPTPVQANSMETAARTWRNDRKPTGSKPGTRAGYGSCLAESSGRLSRHQPRLLPRGRIPLAGFGSRIVDLQVAVRLHREFQIVTRVRSRKVGDKGCCRIVRRAALV
jgi:hypothetical protein